MKKIFILFALFLSVFSSHKGHCQKEGSKSTELYIKAGTFVYTDQIIYLGRGDDGDHYHESPSSGYAIKSTNNGKLNNYSPYINLGIFHKGKKWFGFYTGLTYTQFKQSFTYSSYNVSNFVVVDTSNLHYLHYNEYDDKATGNIINHVFRIEFTPVFFIKKTKISFPFINLDLVFPQIQTNLIAQRQYYQNIAALGQSYSITSSIPLGNLQSVPISISKNDFTYSGKVSYYGNAIPPKHIPFIYFPLSIKVEQEILIAKTKWLLGASAFWSARAAYYGFNFYVGYCIWKSAIL